MDSVWFVLLLVNLTLSFVVAYAAGQKGRSSAAFWFLSFFLSFVVAILVLIALPGQFSSATSETNGGDALLNAQCPYCKEAIRSDAIVCKHCGREVTPTYEMKLLERETLLKQEQAAEAARVAAIAEQSARQKAADKKTNRIVFLVVAMTVALGVIWAVWYTSLPKTTQTELRPNSFGEAVQSCVSTVSSGTAESITSIDANGKVLRVLADQIGFQSCLIGELDPQNADAIRANTLNHPIDYSPGEKSFDFVSGALKYTFVFPDRLLTIERISD